MLEYIAEIPCNCLLGVTVETNRDTTQLSKAPRTYERTATLMPGWWRGSGRKLFITIEPILAFDLDQFADGIIAARPDFVNIGADSKGHNLPEPTWEQVQAFIVRLQGAGIEIREKRNLERLKEASR
jgi:hypothetical protein